MKKDCGWREEVVLQVPFPDEGITDRAEGFLNVFTYPFTLGPLDRVVFSSVESIGLPWPRFTRYFGG